MIPIRAVRIVRLPQGTLHAHPIAGTNFEPPLAALPLIGKQGLIAVEDVSVFHMLHIPFLRGGGAGRYTSDLVGVARAALSQLVAHHLPTLRFTFGIFPLVVFTRGRGVIGKSGSADQTALGEAKRTKRDRY